MLYQVRAYALRAAGESGRFTPADTHTSGDYRTAQHVAKQLAQYHGAAVVENKETGNRTWL